MNKSVICFFLKFSVQLVEMAADIAVTCGYKEPSFGLCCLSEGKETGTRRRFHFCLLSSPTEFSISTHISRAAGIVQSVWQLAMGWMVQASNPGGVRFSVPPRLAPRPTQPPLQWVPGLYRGVERPERDANHPSPCQWVGAVTPPPLGACTDMSWSDLY